MRVLTAALLFAAVAANAQVVITVDRNQGAAATPEFKFKRVPPPSADDAATHATVTLIAGDIGPRGSGSLASLTDGVVPSNEDQPEKNLFFKWGTWGGRVRFDFGAPIDIAAIDSYSWHPDSRAPQLYKVYGAAGTEANLDLAPPSRIDPATVGWKFIALVDTRDPDLDHEGGQYGVRISDVSGWIGRYRYLLFDFFDTEGSDNWGNTFYSEVDVLERK